MAPIGPLRLALRTVELQLGHSLIWCVPVEVWRGYLVTYQRGPAMCWGRELVARRGLRRSELELPAPPVSRPGGALQNARRRDRGVDEAFDEVGEFDRSVLGDEGAAVGDDTERGVRHQGG